MVPLISAHDLTSRLRQERPPVLLDIRWTLAGPGRQDYESGHLPGAVFVDLDRELAAPPGTGGRHPLPEPADLERALRRAGVDEDRAVVVYDAGNGMSAARAWWLLRWAGHEQVMVLDGGYAAWISEGLPVTTEQPEHRPGGFVVRPGHMPVVDAEEAASLAREGYLLDARAPERYRGEVEPMDPRAGHIPGALNAPFTEHVLPSGQWKSAAALAERFTRMGVNASTTVGAYCGSGVSACSVLLALEYAGVSTPENPAALYAGSWSHWSADPERPVATGEQAG